jgi:hypothetical protein
MLNQEKVNVKTSSAYCLKKWSKSKSDPKLAFRLVFGKYFCLAYKSVARF